MEQIIKEVATAFLDWQQDKGYYCGEHGEWYSYSGELIGSTDELYSTYLIHNKDKETTGEIRVVASFMPIAELKLNTSIEVYVKPGMSIKDAIWEAALRHMITTESHILYEIIYSKTGN